MLQDVLLLAQRVRWAQRPRRPREVSKCVCVCVCRTLMFDVPRRRTRSFEAKSGFWKAPWHQQDDGFDR